MDPVLTESSEQLLWAYRAFALAELDHPGPAIAAFGKLNPPLSDHVQVRYHRGMARLAAGEINGAESDLCDIAVALPRRAILRTHIEARLAGRRSRWRARVLDLAARLIRPDTSLASEADVPLS